MELIDPRHYRGFCLRGEGRRNFVISAKNEKSGIRIVWRLEKHRKSGVICAKPKCEILNEYIARFITPLIHQDFLITSRIIQMHVEDLKYIAKIPQLPHNVKVENFDELKDPKQYPTHLSVFPNDYQHLIKTYPLINILEMPDATRIPKRFAYPMGPTITVEIKPKQGFFQQHPGVEVPFCNNCILQIEKWRSAAFSKMYDFCPLELYSGELPRMFSAINSLITEPHRNMRIFVDGNPVHDSECTLNREVLNSVLFPNSPSKLDLLNKALCCILAGVSDDSEPFYLRDNSILATLLKAQKLDSIGIVQAYEIYQSLPQALQERLLDKRNLLERNDYSFLTSTDARSLLERYFVAATLKDCSLMISLREVSTSSLIDPLPSTLVSVRSAPGAPRICFAFSIRVVDLDPKSPRNLINAYERFVSGIRTIREVPNIHKSCHI